MYLLLVFLSLIGSCTAGLFGRHLGSWGSAFITTSCLFLSFLISVFAFYEVALVGCCVYIKLTTWISSEVLNIDCGFMFDSLTATMCVVVTFISFLVHLYSTEYMSHDPHLARFMSYLSLFTFFMLILVTADNFVQMFVGWEGVGLCSYLLINFWFTRIQANKTAMKAMVLNRIGDFCLIIGILLIYLNFKAIDYATVSVLAPFLKNIESNFLNINFNLLSLIGIFLFLGAVGKSAQLGLHTWLPDAMEGPTPVSALIHAATMVTAGVFLIARSSFIYEHITNVLGFITTIGALTAIFASTTGLVQNDMKRVIAYLACGQLGYMFFTYLLSNYSAGIFHLAKYIFFRSLVLLSAGYFIHAINDERKIGLKKLFPFTSPIMVIGSLAIIGFPFLTGFYSKDLILEASYDKHEQLGYFIYIFRTFDAFLTAFYSTRLLYIVFLSTGHKKIIGCGGNSGAQIVIALGCLAIPSIFIESVLIFFMLLILSVWSSREKKILAYYYFLYILLGSVLMLLSILYIYYQIGTIDYELLLTFTLAPLEQKILWFTFFLAFSRNVAIVPMLLYFIQNFNYFKYKFIFYFIAITNILYKIFLIFSLINYFLIALIKAINFSQELLFHFSEIVVLDILLPLIEIVVDCVPKISKTYCDDVYPAPDCINSPYLNYNFELNGIPVEPEKNHFCCVCNQITNSAHIVYANREEVLLSLKGNQWLESNITIFGLTNIMPNSYKVTTIETLPLLPSDRVNIMDVLMQSERIFVSMDWPNNNFFKSNPIHISQFIHGTNTTNMTSDLKVTFPKDIYSVYELTEYYTTRGIRVDAQVEALKGIFSSYPVLSGPTELPSPNVDGTNSLETTLDNLKSHRKVLSDAITIKRHPKMYKDTTFFSQTFNKFQEIHERNSRQFFDTNVSAQHALMKGKLPSEEMLQKEKKVLDYAITEVTTTRFFRILRNSN